MAIARDISWCSSRLGLGGGKCLFVGRRAFCVFSDPCILTNVDESFLGSATLW